MNDQDERPTKTPKSGEGCYVNEDGTLDDTAFHAEILDNPEADAATRRATMERAIRRGMDPAMARRLYGQGH